MILKIAKFYKEIILNEKGFCDIPVPFREPPSQTD